MKFERKYTEEDGTTETWYYDTTRNTAGPIKVEITYSKKSLDEFKEIRKKKKQKA